MTDRLWKIDIAPYDQVIALYVPGLRSLLDQC
jgi:hypothetical protein